MNSSFNKEAIKDYSRQYADIVMQSFFQNKTEITGNEILQLTEIKQINLFLLKLLFDAWQSEMDKLKSPYFDMENSEVQQALTKYKNTISRHILVNKTDSQPLLENAVYKALLIILSPYHYYEEELKDFKGKKDLQLLKNSIKFTKVNQSILEAIITTVEKETTDSINSDELLNHVLEETDLIPDDSTINIEYFNKVFPIDFNTIYLENESDEAVQETSLIDADNSSNEDVDESLEEIKGEHENKEVEDASAEVNQEIEEESEPFEDNEATSVDGENNEIEENIEAQNDERDENAILEEEALTVTENPVNEDTNSHELFDDEEDIDNEENEIDDEKEDETIEESVEQKEVIEDIKVEEEEGNIDEKQTSTEHQLGEIEEDDTNDENIAPENNPLVTLNDTFSTGNLETLADLHEKQGIDKIETNITLNQRFMFVNGLFDGDVDTFNSTIKNLDSMGNHDEALNYIASNFSQWDKTDEDVIEFFDLIKKRFV